MNVYLFPSAAGTYQEWANGAGTVPTNVQTNDGDTSYRQDNSSLDKDTFVMDDLPAYVAVVVSYTARFVAKAITSNVNVRNYVYESPNEDESGVHSVGTSGYDNYNNVFATHPSGSGWTVANVNSCELGMKYAGSGVWCRVTQVLAIVEYLPQAGGFAKGLVAWLPPLMAVASHCLSKSDILTVLSSFKTRPSTDEEFARIIEAFKRRPVYGWY